MRDAGRLELGFRQFCHKTADEQVRTECLLLLTTAAVAFLSCCTVVALGVVLATVVGHAASLGDWVVTGACLLVLALLHKTLGLLRTPILVAVCAGLAALVAGPLLVTNPSTAIRLDVFLERLASDGNGLALGVFLAALAMAAIVAVRWLLDRAMGRAERLRHRTIVPDVKAFEQFHGIVSDMIDDRLVLAGPARVALARRVSSAADWVEKMVHLYDDLDGLGHQRNDLRNTLRSLATHLRKETRVLVSTIDGDVEMLKCCVTCLAAISIGHAGYFPGAAPRPAATRARRLELVKLRTFAAASMALACVAATAALGLRVGAGTAFGGYGLIALLAAVAPEPLLRSVIKLDTLSHIFGWLPRRWRQAPADKAEGDQ